MKKRAAFLILLVTAGLFIFGLWELFRLRFEVGDVYPAYSSLRADPLGTMALFESLERTPGISVTRDFRSDGRLPDGRGTTYLHLAADWRQWRALPKDLWQEIGGFVSAGGRLAVIFRAEAAAERMPRAFHAEEAAPVSPKPAKEPKKKSKRAKQASLGGEELVSLHEHWGVQLGLIPLLTGQDDTYQPAQVARRADLPLPKDLEWHSGLIFTNCSAAWKPVYVRGRHPVVIERKFGAGSVVLATDTSYLSNEALRRERQPELLAWIVGPVTRVVFDEAHLGIVESLGVAGLVRKYRLHAFVAGLAILAALFLWQNAFSFVPLQTDSSPSGHVTGKEAAFGFVNLLRRNIRARELLGVCLAEWKKHVPAGDTRTHARAAEAEGRVKTQHGAWTRPEALVQGYRALAHILNPPKR